MVDYANNGNYIREVQRDEMKGFRKEQKDKFLNRIRGGVCDDSANISLEKMKELNEELLKLTFKEINAERRLHILSQIRIGSCFGDEYIKIFLQGKSLQSVIHSLKLLKDAQCQLEAAACLTNFSTGNHDATQILAKKAGPFIIEFISSSNPQLQSQCIWAVTNICNDCELCFLSLKKQGLISALLTQLESSYQEVMESVVCALVACTQYEGHHFEMLNVLKIAHSLSKILNKNSDDMLLRSHALFTLSNIYKQTIDFKLEDVMKETFNIALRYFIETVSDDELQIQVATACIRCLGIATVFSNEFCDVLGTSEAFATSVFKVLCSQHSHLKKEILWILINILASINIETPNFALDLQKLVHSISLFICPLDDKALEAMYLLCILLSKHKKCKQFISETVLAQVHVLRYCDRNNLGNCCKCFYKLIEYEEMDSEMC